MHAAPPPTFEFDPRPGLEFGDAPALAGWKRLILDRRGVATIEYALLAALISIAIITGTSNVGGKVVDKYEAVDQSVADAVDGKGKAKGKGKGKGKK